MSRINNKNVKIGDSYVLPLKQSSLSKYEARVESLMNDVELEKQKLLEDAEKEAEKIKHQAELVVQNAHKKAEDIINRAEQKAQEIINKANIEQEEIQNKTEEISNNAYNEGFEKGQVDGLEKFKQDSLECIKSLETLAKSSFEIKQNIVKSADLDIIELVIEIARKITSKSFDENMLKEITLRAINQLKNKEDITIIVNPALVQNIIKLSEEFKQELSQVKNIKIIEDNALSCDGVIVETPLSRVDSRVSSQIDEIAQKLINGITDDVQ